MNNKNNLPETKIIMYDSEEAAIYRTDIKGWVSADGIFCGDGKQGENSARYRGATHTKCECGEVIKMRTYTICDNCRHKKAVERYNALPFKEWDGSPVCTWDVDKYFFNEDDLNEYCYDNELETVNLLFCVPNQWQQIEPDYWADEMPEDDDGELPTVLKIAVDNLNAVIKTLKPISYSPGKIRTSYTLKPESNE